MSPREPMIGLVVVCLFFLMSGCEDPDPEYAGASPPPVKGMSPPEHRTFDYTHKVVDMDGASRGHRPTIAILRFGDTRPIKDVPFGVEQEPPKGGGDVSVDIKIVGREARSRPPEVGPLMNKRARDILKHALVQREAFRVVERERILEIVREINFGSTKYVDPATGPKDGELYAVRYLIEGSLGPNEDLSLKETIEGGVSYKEVDIYEPGFTDNLFRPAKVKRERRQAKLRELQARRFRARARQVFNVACYLSAYDVHTGEVVITVMGLGRNGREAVTDAVEELADEFTDLDSGPRVAAVTDDSVYLDVGRDGYIAVGDRFRLVHLDEPIRDRDGRIVGHKEKEVGEIEVRDVRQFLSVAVVITSAGGITRGDVAKPARH